MRELFDFGVESGADEVFFEKTCYACYCEFWDVDAFLVCAYVSSCLTYLIMNSLANPISPTYTRFDIVDFSRKAPEDENGMLQTAKSLNEIISEEVDSGIPASRIVLGGFSQGGAMSLLTGLTSERKLAGLAVLSGWVPLREKFKAVRFFF